MERPEIERLLENLYAARLAGDLERLCALFCEDADFKISGSSEGKPVCISARGREALRAWLLVLVKTFKVTERHTIRAVIGADGAAVEWQAAIVSKVTGLAVTTKFIDMIGMRDGRIASYSEVFVPC